MDINALFTDEGMRSFTDRQRDQHMKDAAQYAQIADIIKRRLQQEKIAGDRRLSARLRAWKVSRQVKAMEKDSRAAASAAEALYGAYVNEVLELPQRRETATAKKLERKQGRQAAVGGFAAKSLTKSAQAMNGTQPDAGSAQAAPQFLEATPYPFPMAAGGETGATRTVADYFPREQGR